MLESRFSKDYVSVAIREIALATYHERAEISKHCDMFTKGVPDLTASFFSRTFWIESKVLHRGDQALREEIRARKQQLQHLKMTNLYHATRGKATYLVRDERGPDVLIYWVDPTNLTHRNGFFHTTDPRRTLEEWFHIVIQD